MVLDFTQLSLQDTSPIYMQIVRYIKIKIAANQIANGDELPSRRMLSTILNVNPNTVQKAYKQIEQDGLLVSYAGSKSILVFDETVVTDIRHELIAEEASNFITSLKQIGISKEEAGNLLASMWYEEEEKHD